MRIYISCDMEGVAGVSVWRQCDYTNASEYPTFRRYMSQEVAAAIEGAREGGADEIVVNDSHGSMVNLLFDELPEDVLVVSGSRKPGSMTQGLTAGFDGAIFTGYHAKAGHQDGVLAHTYNGAAIFEIRINGAPCSEGLANAALAGTFDVPLIMLTGDKAIVNEISSQMPWVTGVAVKEGIGKLSAASMTPKAAQKAIHAAAARAVRNISSCKPFRFSAPYELEVVTTQNEHTDFIEMLPGVERIDGRTTRFVSDDFLAVYRTIVLSYRLAAAAGAPA